MSRHCTQERVVGSQAGALGLVQSASTMHSTHTPGAVSQAGVRPPQSSRRVHCTQRPSSTLQTGLVPPQSPLSLHSEQTARRELQTKGPEQSSVVERHAAVQTPLNGWQMLPAPHLPSSMHCWQALAGEGSKHGGCAGQGGAASGCPGLGVGCWRSGGEPSASVAASRAAGASNSESSTGWQATPARPSVLAARSASCERGVGAANVTGCPVLASGPPRARSRRSSAKGIGAQRRPRLLSCRPGAGNESALRELLGPTPNAETSR